MEDEENASWLANLALPGGSASPPLRRLHPAGAFGAQGRCLTGADPAQLLGCSSSKPFPCIGGDSGGSSGGGSSSAEVLAAFRREVQSPLVLSALCALERSGLHPLGDDGEDFFCSLEGTAAGGLRSGCWRGCAAPSSLPTTSTLVLPSMPAYYRATGCYLTGTVPVRCPQHCPFTAAGLLVLCRRARIGSWELSSELLLTLLWIIESCESQCECGWAEMH